MALSNRDALRRIWERGRGRKRQKQGKKWEKREKWEKWEKWHERDGVCGTLLSCPLENLFAAGTRGDRVRVDGRGRALVGGEREGGGRGGDCGGERWRRTWPRPVVGLVAALAECICKAFLVAEPRAVLVLGRGRVLGRVYLHFLGLS